MESKQFPSMQTNGTWMPGSSTPIRNSTSSSSSLTGGSLNGSSLSSVWGHHGDESLSSSHKRPEAISPSRPDLAFQQYQQSLHGSFQMPSFRLGSMPPPKFQIPAGKTESQAYASAGSTLDSNSTTTSDFNIEEAETVVSSSKEQVDVLITAMMMQDTPDSGIARGVDAVEVAHRVMTRLTMSREENKRSAELANGQAAAVSQAQNVRLMRENEELKAKVAEQRQKKVVGYEMH